MKKSHEEREMEAIIQAQAANTVMWQKQAQAGQEMQKWVEDGNYNFIQTRILSPIELECFKGVKKARLGSSAIANIAKIQGRLEVFEIIQARIEGVIHTGKDALDHLKDLQDTTQSKEGV